MAGELDGDALEWVGSAVDRISRELDLPIDRGEWLPASADDRRRLVRGLEIFAVGQRIVIDFTDEELDDCLTTPEVQRTLEERIRDQLRSVQSRARRGPRGIGF